LLLLFLPRALHDSLNLLHAFLPADPACLTDELNSGISKSAVKPGELRGNPAGGREESAAAAEELLPGRAGLWGQRAVLERLSPKSGMLKRF